MKSKSMRIAVYGVALAVVLATAYLYIWLPEKIPMHWDFNGNVRYDPKAGIWGLPAMLAAFAVMFDILPHIDPRKRNYEKFGAYYDGFCLFMQLFLAVMWLIIIVESFRPGTISVGKTVMIMLGILFLFMGNMLPKAKSNFYLGIKTPWALSDDEVWRKTQRLGGWLMFLAGIVALGTGFFLDGVAAGIIFFTALMAATIIPYIMSYVWWKRMGK